MSSRLGSMVVRLALENLAGYKADLNQAATDTNNAADKIEQGTGKATTGITRMGGAMGGVAETAVSLASSAGLAGAAAGALAIGIGAAAYAAHQGSKEQQEYQRALILTGNVSGVTASQMQGMAAGIDKVVGTQAKAASALAAMAGTGQVAGSNLQAFSQVAVQMERTVGTSVEDTAKVFAQLGEEPVKASLKLNESMNYLTAATYSQIKAAEDLGDKEKAADIAQTAYATAAAARTEQIKSGLGTLERAWISVKSVAAETWDAMLGIGRQTGPEQALEAAKKSMDSLQARLTANGDSPEIRRRLQLASEEVKNLSMQVLRTREVAYAEADRANTQKEGIAAMELVDKANEKALNKQKQMTKALDEYHQALDRIRASTPTNRRLDPEQIAQTEAAIRKRYATETHGLTEAQKGLALYNDLTAQSGGLNADFAEKWARLSAAFQAGTITVDQLTTAQKALLEQQKFSKDEMRAQEEAAKASAKAFDAVNKAYEKEVQTAENSVASAAKKLQTLQDENVAAGIAEQQHISMAQAIELVVQKRLEEQMVIAQANGNQEVLDALRQELDLRKQIAGEVGVKEARESSRKAADESVREWQKAADKINDSITDALMRGFESGKGFVANLRDTAVNMFKTMVLRPIISPVGNMLAGGGMGGMGGTANTLNSLGGMGNSASGFSIAGLGNPFTNIGGFMGNGVADFGSFLVDKGFTSVGTSMESFGLTMKANEAAINGFGDALGYANSAMLASEGKWGAAVGSAVGTYFGGPIGAAIGQAVGGWVDEAFGGGHEYTTGTGISGSFGASGFSGRNYQDWRNEGSSGFFGFGASGSSSGTNYSALDASTAKGLSSAFMAVRSQTAGFAKALGLSADDILGFSKDIKLGLGSDAEANKKAISDLLTGIADDLAKKVLDTQYIREGETAASTLARLSTNLQAVNQVFDTLDFNMVGISQAGGDAASQLVDLMGGLESFQSTAARFNQNYYSEAERNAKTTEQLSDSFAGLGLAMPGSLQGFRDLVKEQDVSTDSGRAMVAALMGMSDAFYTVTKAATDAQASLLQTKFFTSYSDYAAASAQAGVTAAPKFAAGGDHTGGLRWVGERGMELEATGASRIWNAGQLAAALNGNAGGSASLMQTLLEQGRAQGRAMTSLLSQMVDRLERWEVRGMPEVRTL